MGGAQAHPDGWFRGLEDDYLGAYRQVLVVVVGAGDGQVDAAVRRGGEAAAVEGDAASGEEHRPRHRVAVGVADEVRAGLPRDLERAARRRVDRARGSWLHRD